MTLAPIIVFNYNRPDHSQQVWDALASNEFAKDSELYLYCDGPKVDASEEMKQRIFSLHNQAKHYAENVLKDGKFKEIHVICSEVNKGLRTSIISGVTEVINKHGRAIVLEDDLVTSPYFINYMNRALDKYENYKGVFSISAQSYINPKDFPADYHYDVYACQTHLPTGWATWADRWNIVDWDIDKKMSLLLQNETFMRNAFMRGGQDLYYRSLKDRLNGLDVWSICFSLEHFKNHAVSILPVISYIHNIGFDGSGMNSGNTKKSALNHSYYVDAKRDPRLLDVVYEDSRIINMWYSGSVMQRRSFIKRVINRIGCILTGKSSYISKGEVYKL